MYWCGFLFGDYMALSVCCQWLQERKKRNGESVYENIIEEKALQLGQYRNGKYSDQKILSTYHHNVDEHIKFFPKLIENNIKSFRISSSLFPLYEFAGNLARNDQSLINKLAYLGGLFFKHGIRVTTHPGQFTIINSNADRIIQNSIRELEYHAWIFDMMGFDKTPHYAINIHGGKRGNLEKLVEVTNTLPENVKSRLTFENDERCFNVKQLLTVHEKTGVPIVLDTHHHSFGSNDLSLIDAFYETLKTWGKIKPLQHLSNTEVGKQNGSFSDRRSHSKFIHYVPDIQLAAMRDNFIDVDVEAKMKNLALIKLRQDYEIKV